MSEQELKVHLNIGGPRGWTTACGIESSSFIDQAKAEDHWQVDCKRCRRKLPESSKDDLDFDEEAEEAADASYGA